MQKYEGKALAIVVFESLMAIFYCLAGLSMIFWQKMELFIASPKVRLIVGVVLLLYGAFRVYRAIKKLF